MFDFQVTAQMSLLFVSGIRSPMFVKKRERASKRTKVFCIVSLYGRSLKVQLSARCRHKFGLACSLMLYFDIKFLASAIIRTCTQFRNKLVLTQEFESIDCSCVQVFFYTFVSWPFSRFLVSAFHLKATSFDNFLLR